MSNLANFKLPPFLLEDNSFATLFVFYFSNVLVFILKKAIEMLFRVRSAFKIHLFLLELCFVKLETVTIPWNL